MVDEAEVRERKRKMTVIQHHQVGAPIVLRGAVRRSSAPGKVRLQPQRVRYTPAQLKRHNYFFHFFPFETQSHRPG